MFVGSQPNSKVVISMSEKHRFTRLADPGGTYVALNTKITWQGGMKFEATPGSGHTVVMDSSSESGGTDDGPRPTEMVLMGLGGCSGIDVVWILNRMRVEVDKFEMELEAERAETDPKVFISVSIIYKFWGEKLPQDKIARAIKLSEETYCSVANMINKTAKLTTYMELNGTRTVVTD